MSYIYFCLNELFLSHNGVIAKQTIFNMTKKIMTQQNLFYTLQVRENKEKKEKNKVSITHCLTMTQDISQDFESVYISVSRQKL